MNKIAILSNITIDMVKDIIKKSFDVFTLSGFDTWQYEILNQDSGIYEKDIRAIYLILHVDTFEDEELIREKIMSWIDSINILISKVKRIPVFVSTLDIWDRTCKTYSERQRFRKLSDMFDDAVGVMNSVGEAVYYLPVAESIHDMGRREFYSEKMWYIGNMPYSMQGIKTIGQLIIDSYNSINGKKKKCIAVDLDGTLWGGVVGEDGWNGIILSNHKEGQRFQDLQKVLKQLKDQGVILIILSKNNQNDVQEVFDNNEYMILKPNDFVDVAINWESKYINLKKIVKKINIGLDSVVFLDDNPAEREQMKQMCPEVEVIDFPKDTSQLVAVMEKVYKTFFKCLELTKEDGKKTEMYHSEVNRAQIKEEATSLDDYIGKLEIQVDIHEMNSDEIIRVVQLVNKTNQFNTTTKRYSEIDINKLMSESYIFVASMRDKFGDNGLVSIVILKEYEHICEIDSFIMSCRVMGRKLENVFIQQIRKWLKKTKPHISMIKAKYVETKKNEPVKTLYDRLGFDCINDWNIGKEYQIKIDDIKMDDIPYANITGI